MFTRKQFLTALAAATRVDAANYTADVIVYGATPAGMAAAQAASRAGAKVCNSAPGAPCDAAKCNG